MAVHMLLNKDEIEKLIAQNREICDADFNNVLLQILRPKQSIGALGILIIARIFNVEVRKDLLMLLFKTTRVP